MTNKHILSLAYKRIAAMTDREFWQGCQYLGISSKTAKIIRRAALRAER